MRGFADLVARRWQRARRRHLGDPRRRRPPRALQADGLARPRPGPAHRRHPPHSRAGNADAGRPRATPSPPRSAAAASTRARAATPAATAPTDLDAGAAGPAAARHRGPRDSPRVARHRSTPSASELRAGGPLLYRYPPGTRRPARHRRRLPALLVLARPGARPHRPARRSGRAVRGRCSTSPARSASTPRRWTPRPARTSATTRRRSPTPRSSRPPSPSATPPRLGRPIGSPTRPPAFAAEAAAPCTSAVLVKDTVEVEQARVQPIVGGQTARLSP